MKIYGVGLARSQARIFSATGRGQAVRTPDSTTAGFFWYAERNCFAHTGHGSIAAGASTAIFTE